jgi:O-antigen/teichoic acid export membrane protein
MNSQRKQYIVNLLATFASQGFTAGSILLLTPILLSNLGTELFSLYGIILNLILIFAIFDIGFNTGLLRRLIHEQAQASTLISTCFYFFLAISPLVFLAIWGFINIGWLFAANQSLPISSALLAVLLAAWVLLNMQAALFDVVLQSLNKIFVGKVIRIVKTIVEFGLIWWASYQQNIIWMIACLLVTNLLYVFAMYLIAKRAIPFRIFFPTAFISSCKLHINYSIWYGLSAIAGVLVYNAQTVLMGTQLSTSSIAIILVVAKFYEVVKVGLANFTVILFPGIVLSEAKGQWHTIFVQYKKKRYFVLDCW